MSYAEVLSAEHFAQNTVTAPVVMDTEGNPDESRRQNLLDELLDPVEFIDPYGGQRLSGLCLNREAMEDPTMVVVGGFLAQTNEPGGMYGPFTLAALAPKSPILAIDLPNHGRSSPFTPEQRRAWRINETGRRRDREVSLGAVAVAQGRALAEFLQCQRPQEEYRAETSASDRVVLIGDSVGGLLLPHMVAPLRENGVAVSGMIAREPAGTDRRRVLGVLRAFFLQEPAIGKELYGLNKDNEHLHSAFEVFKADMQKNGYDSEQAEFSQYGMYGKDPWAFVDIMLRHSPIARGDYFRALGSTLSANPQLNAAVISGGRSCLNRWSYIEPQVSDLRERFAKQLTWVNWPHDSHGLGLPQQQPRLAAAAVRICRAWGF